MVVRGKGSDVFTAKVVMCSWSLPSEDRESLNDPHTKIREKNERKEKPKAQQMNIANGVRFPWT